MNDNDNLIRIASDLCREMYDSLDAETKAAIVFCASEVAGDIGRASRALARCGCNNSACPERVGENDRAMLIAMMACSAIMRGNGRRALGEGAEVVH